MIFTADLHISRYPGKNAKVRERLLELRTKFPGERLVCLGDLVDDGTEEQYENARELLIPWKGNVTLVVGNHDIGPMGLGYCPESLRSFKQLSADLDSSPYVQENGLNLLALDSTRKSVSPLDAAQGELTATEVYRLGQFMRNAGTKVIALHHDPVNSLWVERLRNSDELFRLTYGFAQYMFFGHRHGTFQWTCPRGERTVLTLVGSLRYDKNGVAWRLTPNGSPLCVLLQEIKL